MDNPGKTSIVLFIGAMLVGAAAWAADAQLATWGDLLEVKTTFALLGTLGSVTVAWFVKAPQKKNGGTP